MFTNLSIRKHLLLYTVFCSDAINNAKSDDLAGLRQG